MKQDPRRKTEAARRANQMIRGRTVAVMLLLGVVTFVLLFGKLYDLQIRRHDELLEKATIQQTRSTPVSALRGAIYDRNYNPLAMSATAENICISPMEIAAYVTNQRKAIETAKAAAAEKKVPYYAPPVLDEDYIARGLSRITGTDQDYIRRLMDRTKDQYWVVYRRAEQPMADEVRRFLNGEIDDEGNELTFVNEKGETRLLSDPDKRPVSLQGIFLEPDSKRYYPYGTLASNVIGFVNGENQGAYGLESKFNDVMEGTSGYTVAAKTARNTDLLFHYEQYFDAENGSSLVTTLDTRVQASLEKNMESMLKKFDAKNGGAGIIMNVNTGAIVAMASYPNFDPVNYSTVIDEKLKASLEETLAEIEEKKDTYASEEEYQKAVSAAKQTAWGTQWRNRCVSDTYEPGSTFKPITLATALEEGVVNMNTTFDCSGSIMVKGWDKPFGCSRSAPGHGHQTLKEATGNSCNPAFITMGLAIGTQTYYKYLQSFGLMEPTGFDMAVGEGRGIFAGEKDFNSNVVSLASYAFGQTFNVTPLELIRAQAACINGGYLYTPYVVEQVLDGEGNVVSQHEAVPVRQVISEETSAKVRECLEYVVAQGTGKNGQVAGYRLGGKTGTADKTGTRTDDNPKGDIVVSFMCFAPADDPQYIMLLTMDTPSRTTGTYPSGGNMVAPTASRIMTEILPDLGIEPDYTGDELLAADTPVPNVVGQTLAAARARMETSGFECRTVGSGDTVTDQTPAGGAIVPNDAVIILYLGEEKPDTPCTVPNVVGKTAAEANQALTNAGLILKVAGATASGSGNVHALSQSAEEGTELPAGSVVTVWFGDSSVLD